MVWAVRRVSFGQCESPLTGKSMSSLEFSLPLLSMTSGTYFNVVIQGNLALDILSRLSLIKVRENRRKKTKF